MSTDLLRNNPTSLPGKPGEAAWGSMIGPSSASGANNSWGNTDMNQMFINVTTLGVNAAGNPTSMSKPGAPRSSESPWGVPPVSNISGGWGAASGVTQSTASNDLMFGAPTPVSVAITTNMSTANGINGGATSVAGGSSSHSPGGSNRPGTSYAQVAAKGGVLPLGTIATSVPGAPPMGLITSPGGPKLSPDSAEKTEAAATASSNMDWSRPVRQDNGWGGKTNSFSASMLPRNGKHDEKSCDTGTDMWKAGPAAMSPPDASWGVRESVDIWNQARVGADKPSSLWANTPVDGQRSGFPGSSGPVPGAGGPRGSVSSVGSDGAPSSGPGWELLARSNVTGQVAQGQAVDGGVDGTGIWNGASAGPAALGPRQASAAQRTSALPTGTWGGQMSGTQPSAPSVGKTPSWKDDAVPGQWNAVERGPSSNQYSGLRNDNDAGYWGNSQDTDCGNWEDTPVSVSWSSAGKRITKSISGGSGNGNGNSGSSSGPGMGMGGGAGAAAAPAGGINMTPQTPSANPNFLATLNTLPPGGPIPQMRRQLTDYLVSCGYRREDADRALISANLELSVALADLQRSGVPRQLTGAMPPPPFLPSGPFVPPAAALASGAFPATPAGPNASLAQSSRFLGGPPSGALPGGLGAPLAAPGVAPVTNSSSLQMPQPPHLQQPGPSHNAYSQWSPANAGASQPPFLPTGAGAIGAAQQQMRDSVPPSFAGLSGTMLPPTLAGSSTYQMPGDNIPPDMAAALSGVFASGSGNNSVAALQAAAYFNGLDPSSASYPPFASGQKAPSHLPAVPPGGSANTGEHVDSKKVQASRLQQAVRLKLIPEKVLSIQRLPQPIVSEIGQLLDKLAQLKTLSEYSNRFPNEVSPFGNINQSAVAELGDRMKTIWLQVQGHSKTLEHYCISSGISDPFNTGRSANLSSLPATTSNMDDFIKLIPKLSLATQSNSNNIWSSSIDPPMMPTTSGSSSVFGSSSASTASTLSRLQQPGGASGADAQPSAVGPVSEARSDGQQPSGATTSNSSPGNSSTPVSFEIGGANAGAAAAAAAAAAIATEVPLDASASAAASAPSSSANAAFASTSASTNSTGSGSTTNSLAAFSNKFDGIPEFVPGKPFQPRPIAEDPDATPGMVANPLFKDYPLDTLLKNVGPPYATSSSSASSIGGSLGYTNQQMQQQQQQTSFGSNVESRYGWGTSAMQQQSSQQGFGGASQTWLVFEKVQSNIAASLEQYLRQRGASDWHPSNGFIFAGFLQSALAQQAQAELHKFSIQSMLCTTAQVRETLNSLNQQRSQSGQPGRLRGVVGAGSGGASGAGFHHSSSTSNVPAQAQAQHQHQHQHQHQQSMLGLGPGLMGGSQAPGWSSGGFGGSMTSVGSSPALAGSGANGSLGMWGSSAAFGGFGADQHSAYANADMSAATFGGAFMPNFN